MLVQPANMNGEIRVKIGGDHGGNNFKECYQVCNTSSSNSKDNTVIFSIFEAKDTRGNVRTGLRHYKEQIDELQKSLWK